MAKEQISSILRALQILECFMDDDTEWTLKALVDELDLPRTTVFRQVSTLAERQYLVQDPIRKSYRIGPRLLQLAGAVVNRSDLRRIARPELERLGERVQETVNLSMLLDHDVFYLDKEETHRSIVCNTRIGTRVPAYATSSGKIMLAFQDDMFIEQYCHWMIEHAQPFTKNTIIVPEQLRAQLMEARLNGYAVDNGEIEEGLLCFGAPVHDMNNHVIAAVSISGPEFRMKENEDMFIQEVCSTASVISSLMGYRR